MSETRLSLPAFGAHPLAPANGMANQVALQPKREGLHARKDPLRIACAPRRRRKIYRALLLASGALSACHSSLRGATRDGAGDPPASQAADPNAWSAEVRAPDAVDVALLDTTNERLATAADAAWTTVDGLGPICATYSVHSERGWYDVLAVVDRSSSMDLSMAADAPCDPAARDCVSRWQAVKSVLAEQASGWDHMLLGALLFPSPGVGACAVVPAPQVPPMQNASTAIEQAMTTIAPVDESPTSAAVRVAVAYLAGLGDHNAKAIVLFTDGEPGCGGSNGGSSEAWTDALSAANAAAAANLPLYVVGLGPHPGDLDRLAAAGGTRSHYPATSKQQLENILTLMQPTSRLIGSCTFTAAQPPPDPALVYVFFNGERVPQSAEDGWSFGATPTSIVLAGSYCERAVTLDSVDVQFLFGCADGGAP